MSLYLTDDNELIAQAMNGLATAFYNTGLFQNVYSTSERDSIENIPLFPKGKYEYVKMRMSDLSETFAFGYIEQPMNFNDLVLNSNNYVNSQVSFLFSINQSSFRDKSEVQKNVMIKKVIQSLQAPVNFNGQFRITSIFTESEDVWSDFDQYEFTKKSKYPFLCFRIEIELKFLSSYC